MDKVQFADLQEGFLNYLLAQGTKESTAKTKKSDAFYLARHDNTIDFYGFLYSDDFERLAREHLKNTLQMKSAAKDSNIGLYMTALRDLRKYVLSVHGTYEKKEIQPTHEVCESSIPRPSCALVDMYLQRWDTTVDLYELEKVLRKLFTEAYPTNIAIDEIILKVAVLNTVYNTYIYSVYPVAQHILSLGIDERLRTADETLVNELMCVIYDEGKKINHYSFATKYCSFHNSDAFPIYDSYVDKILRYYRHHENFSSFQNKDLKHYPTFKRIVNEFRSYFGLKQYTVKQIDQYLWQFGKEYFT